MKHITITIFGKVHGVFFRASAKEEADRLGVNGFVCNRSDGSVSIEAEGTAQQLEALTIWCHKGPANARVTNVEVSEGKFGNFSQFQIVR